MHSRVGACGRECARLPLSISARNAGMQTEENQKVMSPASKPQARPHLFYKEMRCGGQGVGVGESEH